MSARVCVLNIFTQTHWLWSDCVILWIGQSRSRSFFFFPHKLFVKVINQLESKREKKNCTTQILFENLFCIKYMQTLTFENYQGQILFHWYMLSSENKLCFALNNNKKKSIIHVHIIHVKNMWCTCLQIIVFLYVPSVLFPVCSLTPVDLPPTPLHWLKVEPSVCIRYFLNGTRNWASLNPVCTFLEIVPPDG